MIGFIDDNRAAYVVEPICKVLPIAPSTYHARWHNGRIPPRLHQGPDATSVYTPRSAVSSRQTLGFMVCARCADSSAASVRHWPTVTPGPGA
jgi:hypothetical protein